MRTDRIFAAAFVALVSTAIVGFSAGNTGASFTGTTTNPGQILNTQTVAPPASFTSATAAIAGRIDLVWTATTSSAGSHTLTYLVLRGPVGGPYAQVGTTSGLTYSDTPPSDGTYEYVVQTKIAQGVGFFTSGDSATKSNKSDRTAPTMSATCNGGSCTGWFNTAVTFVVGGNDGAGVGMGTATTNVDSAGAVTSAAPRTVTVSGDSASHSVVYSGADAAGNASSNASQTIKIDTTAPPAAALSSAKGTVTNGDVVLTWSQAADGTSGVATFDTYKKTVANGSTACGTTGFTAVSTGLAASTTTSTVSITHNGWACFYVVTHDAAGNMTQSNISGPTQGK